MTAVEEKHITRGWVDVCWIWQTLIMPRPLYLLVAEIETSKSDWTQIRSNAAKAVELRPLLYAHIFRPGIRLTPDEKNQLAEIHHGRHVLILDDDSSLDEFFAKLQNTSRKIFAGNFVAFSLIAIDGFPLAEMELRIAASPGVLDVFRVFGNFDFIALFSVDALDDMPERICAIRKLKGIKATSTIMAFREYDAIQQNHSSFAHPPLNKTDS